MSCVTSFSFAFNGWDLNRIDLGLAAERVDMVAEGVAIATFPDGSRLLFRGVEQIPADATAEDIDRMVAAFAEGA